MVQSSAEEASSSFSHYGRADSLEPMMRASNEPQSGILDNGTQSNDEDTSDARNGRLGVPTSADHVAPKEWYPIMLHPPWLATILFAEVGLMLAIIVLNIISVRNSGFVRVNDLETLSTDIPVLNRFWSQAFLWTVFPNFIFQAYKVGWDSVVSGLMVRQPYIDLKAGSARAENSIMLDYRTDPSPVTGFIALWNGHRVAGCSALLGLIVSLAVVPLSAHLFEAAPVTINTSVPATYTHYYNDSAYTATTDLRSIFDTVAATRIYGGSPPPWTDAEYAFQPFSAPAANTGSINNLTINNIAYSAYLSCEIINSSNYIFHGNLSVSYDDRGCSVSNGVPVTEGNIIATWSTEDCSAETGYSRFGLIAAQFSPTNNETHLSNISLLSCIPTYWTTPGILTVTTNGGLIKPIINSFSNSNASSRIDRGYAWVAFETALHEYITSSPNMESYETDIGNLIFTYSTLQLNSGSTSNATSLVISASTIFTSVFAVLASTTLFQQIVGDTFIDINGTTNNASTSAIFSSSQTRLFVVSPVAYIIIGVLALLSLYTIIVAIYTHTRHSILHESPVGLLSYAAILKGSDVNALVNDIILLGEKPGMERKWWKRYCKCWKAHLPTEAEQHELRSSPNRYNPGHSTSATPTDPGNATNMGSAINSAHNESAQGEVRNGYYGRPREIVEHYQLVKRGKWAGTWGMRSSPPLEKIVFERSQGS